MAPDFNRSVLDVRRHELQPAAHAQRGLRPVYALILYPSYPNQLERPLLLSLIQMLWDRGEPNGYAWHMTDDPLPNTPRHKVLQLLSFGDHQVANVATEVEARTIGSRLRLPAVDPGRHADREPYYGIPRDPPLPLRRRRVARGLGHRPAAPARLRRSGGGRVPRHPAPADHQHAAARGRGPARPRHRVRAARPPADLRVPPHRRRVIDVCGSEPCHAAGLDGARDGPPTPCRT